MKLTGKASLCRTCGEVFSTASNFDRHRVGKHDIAAPHYGRRCLSTVEMEAKGMATNKYGRWCVPNMAPSVDTRYGCSGYMENCMEDDLIHYERAAAL